MTQSNVTAACSQVEVVTAAVRAAEDLHSAVYPAYGPSGRAVIAQTTTRLTITRSGSLILSLVFPSPDPVLSLLLDAANQLHDSTGDGVKRFVIVVKALVKQVAFKNTPCFVNRLLTLQTRLDQSFPTACSCVLTNDVLDCVIRTFFTTRFSPVVSETLASLVFEWVLKLNTIAEVDSYVLNFSLLCLKSSPFPITSSRVQDGFLIKGHWVRRFPTVKTQCTLKVYHHSTETTPEEGEVEMDITEILSEKDEDPKTILFVTNLFLEDRAQYLLNIKNIFFIHGTCSDTAKFLFEQTMMIGKIIVECQSVNDFLWISLPVHQLLLKAPSGSLASEYAEGILDCLKMLNFSFKNSSCTVPANGHFELALAKKLFNSSANSFKRIPPIESREQLLSWKKTLPEETDLLKHLNVKQLEDLDSEAVDFVCRALLCLQTSNGDDSQCLESVELRLAILSKALNLIANICKIDGAFVKPKKGRLV